MADLDNDGQNELLFGDSKIRSETSESGRRASYKFSNQAPTMTSLKISGDDTQLKFRFSVLVT